MWRHATHGTRARGGVGDGLHASPGTGACWTCPKPVGGCPAGAHNVRGWVRGHGHVLRWGTHVAACHTRKERAGRRTGEPVSDPGMNFATPPRGGSLLIEHFPEVVDGVNQWVGGCMNERVGRCVNEWGHWGVGELGRTK